MARNARQNQRMRDERREQILSCALKLFATNGVAATKISDIAAAAEISQGLLYHYYRAKDEIFVELIGNAFAKMNEAALGLEEVPMSPRRKLEQALAELLRSIQESEDFVLTVLLINQASVSDAIPEGVKTMIRDEGAVPYEVMARIFAAGQEDGSIRQADVSDLSLVFWAIIKGLAQRKASHGTTYKAPDVGFLSQLFLEPTPVNAGHAREEMDHD